MTTAKFGSCWSNDIKLSSGPTQKFGPSYPTFADIQGHHKWHTSIRYLWLPISDQLELRLWDKWRQCVFHTIPQNI